MSILVKGVNMPERCAKCFLKSICDKRLYMERRPENCPLIELPPHGDLIDRDELLGQYGGPIWTAKTDYAEGLRDVVADIKYASTVIEADPQPPSGCEDCKYWDGERCANSNWKDCHNSILWWPKEGRE